MKNVFKLFLFSFFAFSCSSSDTENNELNRLIEGKWQLTASLYYDDTDPNQVYEHPVVNGYFYEFDRNGTFTSTEFPDYSFIVYREGSYTISSDTIITLTYTKTGYNNLIKLKEVVDVNNTQLTLEGFFEGNPCIGGCGERFQKITTLPSE